MTVQGLRAAGAVTAARLRPGGVIQREIATRTVGVFAHRLYGAITTAHFMAETVPFVKPATVIRQSQFFGHSVASMPIYGEHRLPRESNPALRALRTVRNLGVFAANLVGLTTGAARDTRDFIDDIDRLEDLVAGDLSRACRRATAKPDPVGTRSRGTRLGAGVGFVHVVRRVSAWSYAA